VGFLLTKIKKRQAKFSLSRRVVALRGWLSSAVRPDGIIKHAQDGFLIAFR